MSRPWDEDERYNGDSSCHMCGHNGKECFDAWREKERLRAELEGLRARLHNFLNATPLDARDDEVRQHMRCNGERAREYTFGVLRGAAAEGADDDNAR